MSLGLGLGDSNDQASKDPGNPGEAQLSLLRSKIVRALGAKMTESKMNIELSKDEVALLRDLLEQRREDLRVEIRRTETPSYHEELRALERAMIALSRKFEKADAGYASV